MDNGMFCSKTAKILGLFGFLALLLSALWSCSELRTELYREETLHRYRGACTLYKAGDYAAAGAGFDEVIAMDPDYGPARAALGHLALIREDYAGALALYRQAIASDPELEADLRPFIMVALAHMGRASLQEAGISLNQIYPLVLADRRAEVEAILEEDIPLRLLANDTMGITPGRLGEMQQKITETADPLTGSVRYRLFAGYLLFYGQTDDDLAAALIGGAAEMAGGRERQEALVVLGQIHERRDNPNAAVDAYLAAVDAGLSMTDVAHHLARVYRVDLESILPPRDTATEEAATSKPMRIEAATRLPPPPADLSPLMVPKEIHESEGTGSRHTF